ncbi:MAG: hypothetical protein WEA10_04985 [Actinomycetota bacterium]
MSKDDDEKLLDVRLSKAYRDSVAREAQLRHMMTHTAAGQPIKGITTDHPRRRGPQRNKVEKRAESRARWEANRVVKRDIPPYHLDRTVLRDPETFAHRLTPIERAIIFLRWKRRVPTLAAVARLLGGYDESTVRSSYQRALDETRWMYEVIVPILDKRGRGERMTAEERAAWAKFREPRGGRASVSGMWTHPTSR